MRVLFVKDESSMLRGLDAKTKLSVMLGTAVLVVARDVALHSYGRDDGGVSRVRVAYFALGAEAGRSLRPSALRSVSARRLHDECGDGARTHDAC